MQSFVLSLAVSKTGTGLLGLFRRFIIRLLELTIKFEIIYTNMKYV